MTSADKPTSDRFAGSQADQDRQTQPVAPRVGQAIYWNTLFMPITHGVGFGLSIVIVWLLGLELYAVYALILSFVSVATVFTNLGIPQATSRFVAELDQEASQEHVLYFLKRVWLLGGVILFAMLVLFNAKPQTLLRWFHLEAYGTWMVVGISLILLFRVGSASLESLLKAFFQHRETNIVQVIYGLIRPVCVVVALLWARDFRGVLVALILAEAAGMWMLVVTLWRYPGARRWKASKPPSRNLWDRFVRFAITMQVLRLLRSCVQADVVILLLAVMVKKPELALIAFAYNLLNRFMVLIQRPVMDVIQPYFNLSAVTLDGREVPRQAATLLSKGTILVYLFGAIGLLCFAPRLVRLLFPPEFESAIGILMILIIFYLTERILSLPSSPMLVAFERNKQIIMAKLLLLLNLPLMFIAYRWLGIVGPAVTAGSLRMLASFLIYFQARKELSWSLQWSFLGRVAVCAFCWGAVLAGGLAWAGQGWLATITMMLIGGLLLVPCLVLPKWFTTAERNLLLSLNIPGAGWALRVFRFEPAGAGSVG